MPKGKFQSPKPTETVDELQVGDFNVHRDQFGDYVMIVGILEGNSVGGVLEVVEQEVVELRLSDLGSSDKALFNNCLKMFISRHIAAKGYTNVTIT